MFRGMLYSHVTMTPRGIVAVCILPTILIAIAFAYYNVFMKRVQLKLHEKLKKRKQATMDSLKTLDDEPSIVPVLKLVKQNSMGDQFINKLRRTQDSVDDAAQVVVEVANEMDPEAQLDRTSSTNKRRKSKTGASARTA